MFILYNASYTWVDAVFQEHAETYTEIADAIFAGLDNEKMAELNAQVDVEGEIPPTWPSSTSRKSVSSDRFPEAA